MGRMTRMRSVLDHLIISLSDRLIGIWACRRSKTAPSGYPLQVLGGFVPQPPVGFPLLSLTRNA